MIIIIQPFRWENLSVPPVCHKHRHRHIQRHIHRHIQAAANLKPKYHLSQHETKTGRLSKYLNSTILLAKKMGKEPTKMELEFGDSHPALDVSDFQRTLPWARGSFPPRGREIFLHVLP